MVSKAALCRCSQPLSGFSARCVEDEQLLNGIVQANPNAKFMYVVDTRPRVSRLFMTLSIFSFPFY
jgi:myotubularin-related protein 6/7/8